MPSMDLFKRRNKSDQSHSDQDSQQLSRAAAVTRKSIFGKIGSILKQEQVTETTWEELEEILIGADIGVQTALSLLERVQLQSPDNPEIVRVLLREELVGILNRAQPHHESDNETSQQEILTDTRIT